MNKKNEHYDYGILGSSRVYTSLDVLKLNEISGKRGINLGIDGSLISLQSTMLRRLVDKGNSFDTIFMHVDPYNYQETAIGEFTKPRLMPFIHDDIIFSLFDGKSIKWQLYRYLPYLRYMEYNFDWGPHNYINHLFKLSTPDHDKTGSYFYPFNEFRGEKNKAKYLFDLSRESFYLDQIIETCANNNIELIIFTAPYASVNVSGAYNENAKKFKELKLPTGVPYKDFRLLYNEELSYFANYNHLNKKGVDAFTTEFSALLE